MVRPNGIITLTSDFGTRDGYAGAVKGVLCSLCPQARPIDLSHAIPSQNQMEAALLVEAVYPWFPAGTVHQVVVDLFAPAAAHLAAGVPFERPGAPVSGAALRFKLVPGDRVDIGPFDEEACQAGDA